ncbi:hypothetical protein NDU88_003951 [Pleurodeles waltl]|uniref:Uncharacterized protein n=1 Tax=Pleurodeles waltl TaxID=8319 RepID=A0AAV7TR68_PLEWA|nr:hypothetical protein NDU88_003951 [Pleurodeles waltl]
MRVGLPQPVVAPPPHTERQHQSVQRGACKSLFGSTVAPGGVPLACGSTGQRGSTPEQERGLIVMGRDKASQGKVKMNKFTALVGGSRNTPEDSEPSSDDTAAILQAIQASKVGVVVALLRQDLHHTVDSVKEAKGRISEFEDTVRNV